MSDEAQHVTPRAYVAVAVGLYILTVMTVLAPFLPLGFLKAPVAIFIASAKAFLVMGYFMHLRYESRLNQLIFASGFFFLAVLMFFCALDIMTRLHLSSPL